MVLDTDLAKNRWWLDGGLGLGLIFRNDKPVMLVCLAGFRDLFGKR